MADDLPGALDTAAEFVGLAGEGWTPVSGDLVAALAGSGVAARMGQPDGQLLPGLTVFDAESLAVVDPDLTTTVPPAVTAATGMDSLAHCAEAFTSRKAHPAIDLYALEGIRLFGRFLPRAVAYPLGTRRHVAHGSACALVFPHALPLQRPHGTGEDGADPGCARPRGGGGRAQRPRRCAP